MSNTRTANRPDDSPFDLNLDALKAEADLTPFVVQWNGRRWSFAHMQEIDSWESIEAAEQGDAAAMMTAFRLALGDEEWAAFRAVPLPQFKLKALFTAYAAHCGMKLGESPASDGS
jgi:hypothetical protein